MKYDPLDADDYENIKLLMRCAGLTADHFKAIAQLIPGKEFTDRIGHLILWLTKPAQKKR
jgi:hypothetical protein